MVASDIVGEFAPPPRRVRLRGGYRCTRWLLALLMVGVPAGFLYAGLHDAARERRLAEEGICVEGFVDGKRTSSSPRSATKYIVQYCFEVEGETRFGSDVIPRPEWEKVETDDRIEVSYWPPDPSLSCYGRKDAGNVNRALWAAWVASGVMVLGFGFALFLCERAWGRCLALLRHGRAVQGEVLSYRASRRVRLMASLGYRFRTAEGKEVDGLDCMRRELDPVPELGAPVLVLQDPNNPKRFASLPRVLEFALLDE